MEQRMRQIVIGFAIGCVIGCAAVLLGLRRGSDGQTALQRAKRPAMHEAVAAVADGVEEKRKESFFTEGPDELKTARSWIARDSLARAARRLEAERTRLESWTQELDGKRVGSRAHPAKPSSFPSGRTASETAALRREGLLS
jgi:hypothetical protein